MSNILNDNWPPNCEVCGRFCKPKTMHSRMIYAWDGPSHEEYVCDRCHKAKPQEATDGD